MSRPIFDPIVALYRFVAQAWCPFFSKMAAGLAMTWLGSSGRLDLSCLHYSPFPLDFEKRLVVWPHHCFIGRGHHRWRRCLSAARAGVSQGSGGVSPGTGHRLSRTTKRKGGRPAAREPSRPARHQPSQAPGGAFRAARRQLPAASAAGAGMQQHLSPRQRRPKLSGRDLLRICSDS